MTFTPTRPDSGFQNGREVSLWRVDQGSSSISLFSVRFRCGQEQKQSQYGKRGQQSLYRPTTKPLSSDDKAFIGRQQSLYRSTTKALSAADKGFTRHQ
uniref:Uncharacterized protein n=1 Tax=Candidatus Kentrum sp. MB TaxID=2138164 RepID=A0A450XXX6_9GAMM|nr:MAG: hypothetical protein BECKMB1821G_GA0114241_100715 [Candidatus Kentron sp. MB]VFK34105.1 MAG: hypothetical protein BECKMB1821I_GA0114274_10616 [Candidatus Kentron sp. MB]VFK76741.1 MAG: hypothetical protein BECKMB1821H_GA0114242_10726 [Candidatus Kentron sp. MB]